MERTAYGCFMEWCNVTYLCFSILPLPDDYSSGPERSTLSYGVEQVSLRTEQLAV